MDLLFCCCQEQLSLLEDFWLRFDDEYPHLTELKNVLKDIQKNSQNDKNYPCNFVIQGATGTGKVEIAENVISPFIFAIGLQESGKFHHCRIYDLCKRGQKTQSLSNNLLHEKFSSVSGQTLIIDDVSDFSEDGDWLMLMFIMMVIGKPTHDKYSSIRQNKHKIKSTNLHNTSRS